MEPIQKCPHTTMKPIRNCPQERDNTAKDKWLVSSMTAQCIPFQAGVSPLMLATNEGNLETVKLLLKAGAQVDLRNKVSL